MIYRLIISLFILAVKYNEDFEVPTEFILEVCKRLKVFSSQNQVNKWQSILMIAMDHKFFVSKLIFDKWTDSLRRFSHKNAPHQFEIIENYFSKPSLKKSTRREQQAAQLKLQKAQSVRTSQSG